jgi:hypothetical protein
MHIGPVDGLLAGITSGPARLLIAVGAVFLGFGVCLLPLPWRDDAFLAIAALAFSSISDWSEHGVWFFFLGLGALIGCFAFLHAFVMERAPSFSLFATFTLAATYLAPVTFAEEGWLSAPAWRWSIALYFAAAFAYWLLPYAFARFVSRKSA